MRVPAGFRPWREAWEAALYGPEGFYRGPEGPAGHFRTACHAAPELLASAVARLAVAAGCTGVVDVGAGRGELLTALAARSGVAPGALRLHGVDVVDRPTGLPGRVDWSAGLAELSAAHDDGPLDGALVVAWELLDVVPCTVVEVDTDGTPRTVHVEPGTGRERPGPPPEGDEAHWCERWWPLAGKEPGSRAEVGLARDRLWAELVGRLAATPHGGLLLAVDYAHDRGTRPPRGTLTGFRRGRQTPPVPDGSCDLTAHVALDAVGEAGTRVARLHPLRTTQREALYRLGVTAGPPPGGPGTGTASAAQVLAALRARSQAAELLDPGGLGGFGWLLQPVGRPVPELLA